MDTCQYCGGIGCQICKVELPLVAEINRQRALVAELLAALELAEPWLEEVGDYVRRDTTKAEVDSHLDLIRMAIKHGRGE